MLDKSTRTADHTELPTLLRTKFHAPPVREQTIVRDRLLEQLRGAADCKLSLVACPPGFGKSTLLAGWSQLEAPQKPVAWVSLDEGDNDPAVLWSCVIEAFRRAIPAIGQALSSDTVWAAPITDVVLPRLVNELEEQDGTGLILDDFHCISSTEASESVAWFVEHVPPNCHVVLATRTEPALPLARLRARAEILELRADDLRFTLNEADTFLNRCLGLELAPEGVEALVERTEGWPAGLYLAALSLQRGADRRTFVQRFGASNRNVLAFLLDEVLETYDPEMQTFMVRSSVLDRLSGPLCDATLGAQDSAEQLDALARVNLFLIALDEQGEWYRFHHLFGELLRMELRNREAELIPTLHGRAFVWHRDHGTREGAIHHAIEAGMFAEAAEIIEASWPVYANVGRNFTVLAWLGRFPEEVLNGDARLLLVQAWMLSLCAQQEEAARVIAALERLEASADGPLPDGTRSVDASLALLRAALPWGDAGDQLTDSLRAAEFVEPESYWRPVVSCSVGKGYYYHGRYDEAKPWLEEASMRALEKERWLSASSAISYRSMIAGEQGRLEEQQLLAEQAMQLTREQGIEESDSKAPLALAISLMTRRRVEEALPLLERAIEVQRSFGRPLDLAHALLQQAAALDLLGQRERSAVVAAEVRALLNTFREPGILRQRLDALASVRHTRPQATAVDALTDAELRVLRLLNSGLSEREMGQELYVSRNTVHSHVRSIYQKLGVSSRVQALEVAAGLGLLRWSASTVSRSAAS